LKELEAFHRSPERKGKAENSCFTCNPLDMLSRNKINHFPLVDDSGLPLPFLIGSGMPNENSIAYIFAVAKNFNEAQLPKG
jgi:hypothetical protein